MGSVQTKSQAELRSRLDRTDSTEEAADIVAELTSLSCENCGEKFSDNSADSDHPDHHCSHECWAASQGEICEEGDCHSCGLSRIGAFDCPNHCVCTCHPENFKHIPEVKDEDSAIDFLRHMIFHRIGAGYHPDTPFDDYQEAVYDDDGEETMVPMFKYKQVQILEARNKKCFEFLNDVYSYGLAMQKRVLGN